MMISDGTKDALADVLGFKPGSHPSPTAELFAEVAKELNEERTKKAKERAKELLTKAIDLRTQRDNAEKQFRAQVAKFDKELGKLMKQIESLAAGKEPEPEGEDKDKGTS